jgi:hypothetical protein
VPRRGAACLRCWHVLFTVVECESDEIAVIERRERDATVGSRLNSVMRSPK